MFFILSRAWDKEKILSPYEESSLGTQNFFFVLRSRQDKNHLSLFLYRAQNLPSLLFFDLYCKEIFSHGRLWEFFIPTGSLIDMIVTLVV